MILELLHKKLPYVVVANDCSFFFICKYNSELRIPHSELNYCISNLIISLFIKKIGSKTTVGIEPIKLQCTA